MTDNAPTGHNRTGIQMSPFDSRAMQNGGGVADIRIDDPAIADLRSGYISSADQLGSVQLPVTVRGAARAGNGPPNGDAVHVLLDKLGERLAFERTATRLYDALITKCEVMPDASFGMTVAELQEIRDDEARHFLQVAEAIDSMGGDPTSQTPSADLAGVESMGLVQVLYDPRTTVAQCLHALLTAELADQAGWEILIALAEEHGQYDMVSSFSMAQQEELGHLLMIQSWYEESIGIPCTDFDDDDLGEPAP